MSDGFNRVLQDANELFEGIERYRSTTPHNAGLCRDAYTKFYRLKERFIKESKNKTLEHSEEQALKQLFADRFMADIMELRKIGDHTEKNRGGYPAVHSGRLARLRLLRRHLPVHCFAAP